MTPLAAGCRMAKLPQNDVHISTHAKPARLAPYLQRGRATGPAARGAKHLTWKLMPLVALWNGMPTAYLALYG